VVRTVNNIASPLGICFSADGKKVYVANENTFNVTIIDVATGIAEAPIHVGVFPYGIAASPDGTTVYVGCIGENAIIAMDTQTHAITPIKVNFGPTGIAVSPDNTRVYATSAQYNGLLKVVNTATKMVIANIPIGDVSTGVCVSPDGSRVYVSNTNSNSVMVIDAVANKVIKTLTVGTRPFGVSLTPDGKYLYVANEDSHNVHVISTADNTIVNVIDVGGQLGISLGNFFAPGTGCTGTPVKFTITVNGSGALTATNATGNISGCAGEVSPTTQQFAFSGGNLSGDITIKAPAGFEVALSRATGFANSLVVPPGPGSAVSGTVLIRALASATTGNIAGDVVLSSPGLPDKNVAVNAVIVALPTANPVSDKSVNNGDIIPVINLTGTAPTYTWTNDMPGIGLPAIGSGDIPSFTAINSGQTPITATITVIPSNSLCNGNTTTFKINIAPSPTITAGAVSGSITACQGTASASPNIQQFTVSGSGLKSDMEIAAPAFTEISLTSTGGYTTKLTLTRTAGTVNPTIVYVRSSASALAGNFTGTVNVSSTGTTSQIVYVSGDINALPVVDQVSPFTFNDGAATIAINFTGTGTSYSWTNDMPGIGLPANGNGDVPSFTAINNGQTVLTATITVTPSNGVCSGSPVVFKITVNPTLVPGISYTSALSPLNTVYGTPSASGSFTVAGTNLAAGVLITPPAGFEVSTDGVDFNNTVTVGGPGTFTAVKVYIRLAKTVAAGSYSGNISLTSGGVSSNIPMPNSTVSPAPVVVTADNKTRSINSENPPLTITYSGFVNNQTEANLIQKPTLATLASLTSAAGNYAITFTGNAQSPNYTFTYVPGVLTITPLGIVIVNAFSPNGDGTNDTWAIKQIEYYPNCTVDIFNRYGAKVFSSLGYDKQWNGQSGGGPVPAGTYYYLINLRDGSAVKAGWVAVIR
jgi:gliding motility-associated-like protein